MTHLESCTRLSALPVQERQGHAGASPAKDYKDAEVIEASDIRGKAKRAGNDQP